MFPEEQVREDESAGHDAMIGRSLSNAKRRSSSFCREGYRTSQNTESDLARKVEGRRGSDMPLIVPDLFPDERFELRDI